MIKILIILFLLISSFQAQAQENCVSEAFRLININRKTHNLNELKWNQNLAKAAQSHANWMAKVGKMTHLQNEFPKSFYELKNTDHHPINRIIKSGYYSFDSIFVVNYDSNKVNVTQIKNINDVWGEIIAHGTSKKSNKKHAYRADVCVKGWMESPGHRDQILKPSFREMGVAISVSKNGLEVFWCVNFGTTDFTLER